MPADLLSPDVIEWVVADEKVAAKWKQIANRLGLSQYVDNIDRNYNFRRKKFERQKLKELFEVWRRASPITFTKQRLMDALGKEGLLDMYSFLQLLDTEDHPKKEQIGRMIDVASNAGTPRSYHSLSPQPPIYQTLPINHSSSSSSTPILRPPPSFSAPPTHGQSSPYSWYFNHRNGDAAPSASSFSRNNSNSSNSNTSPGGGILKKSSNKKLSSISSSSKDYASSYNSDYAVVNGHHQQNGHHESHTDGATSRESTPESLSRQMSRVSIEIPIQINGHSNSSNASPNTQSSTPRSQKTIRFADQVEQSHIDGTKCNGDENMRSLSSKPIKVVRTELKTVPGHQDKSVERYFDNLVSMIEDAAEGL